MKTKRKKILVLIPLLLFIVTGCLKEPMTDAEYNNYTDKEINKVVDITNETIDMFQSEDQYQSAASKEKNAQENYKMMNDIFKDFKTKKSVVPEEYKNVYKNYLLSIENFYNLTKIYNTVDKVDVVDEDTFYEIQDLIESGNLYLNEARKERDEIKND